MYSFVYTQIYQTEKKYKHSVTSNFRIYGMPVISHFLYNTPRTSPVAENQIKKDLRGLIFFLYTLYETH